MKEPPVSSRSIDSMTSSVFLIFENKLNLEKLTIHLAACIYDILERKHQKSIFDKAKNKELLILSIILVSAKFNERDEVLISSLDLRREMGIRCTSLNLRAAEKHVMKVLNWDVSLLTVMHFVQFYYSTGVALKSDQIINGQNKKIQVMQDEDFDLLSKKFIKKCERFADLAVIDNLSASTQIHILALA